MTTSKAPSRSFNQWWLLVVFVVFVVTPFLVIVACCLLFGGFFCDSPFINAVGIFLISVISLTLLGAWFVMLITTKCLPKQRAKRETSENFVGVEGFFSRSESYW
jgi:hypothetical protein